MEWAAWEPSYRAICAQFGRTERAIEGRLWKLGLSTVRVAKAKRAWSGVAGNVRAAELAETYIPARPNLDDLHVRVCLDAGGFCALSERRMSRDRIAVTLPIVWPARAA